MVDAADLKSAGCKTVGVQVPLPPSLKTPAATGFWQGSDGRGGSGVRHDLGTKPQNPRAALTFGVSALDRYVHERVVKGIVAALKKPNLNKEQREFVIPVSTAIKISAESVKAAKANKRLRPTNIIRKQVQLLLHKKPFQSYREIEYAFKLLGVNNLTGQLQTAYGTGDLKAVKIQLANIAKRRNQIVHEGDLVVHERGGQVKWHVIERKYVADSLDFLDLFVAHLDSVV